LLPALTIVENVMLPMDLCNIYEPGERHERAMHLLEQMALADLAERYPAAISAGHQQRAAIARALANNPPIVVADEPTGNLDSRTADDVFELFQSLVSNGKTILMVTHDQELAERVPRIVTIADGRIVDEVLHSSGAAAERMSRAKPVLVDIMRATTEGRESRGGKGLLSPAQATM